MGLNNVLPFVRRLVVYLVGIVVLCMGVVLNTKTGLGTSAMSTIPFAMQRIEGISLGTASVVIYSIFVVIQLVLARRIDVKVLVQVPVSLLFGVGIDFFDMIVFPGQAQGMLDGIPMLFVAIVLTALGITLVVSANLVPVATDGLVKALSSFFRWEFGKAKLAFDATCLCVTLMYSVARVGHPVGIGLGTILAVLFTGPFCALWGRLLGGRLASFMSEGANVVSCGPSRLPESNVSIERG